MQLLPKRGKLELMKTLFFRYFHILACVVTIGIIFTSCSKDQSSEQTGMYSELLQNSDSSLTSTHRWFYFTSDGFKETDIPRNAPKTDSVPWTQAIRITSSAVIDGKAYFTVNKLGLLQAPETFGFQKNGIASETKLIKNIELFSKASVADIFHFGKHPIVNFFTNTIFEVDTSNTYNMHNDDPFLVEFNPETYEYTPLLSKTSLSNALIQSNQNEAIPDFSTIDIREVQYVNDTWNVLFKSNQIGKTDFYSLSFNTDKEITHTSHQLSASIQSVTQYREITRPQPTTALPKKMQELLEPVPNHVSYYLHYYKENTPAIAQFEHSSHNSNPIQGYALGLEHCSLAIFEDGTICFAGGLPSKSVLDNGKTRAFKLPDLGPGYIYGPMALAGSTLIVSWEETSFFNTGASGFLAIDMEQVLYQDSL